MNWPLPQDFNEAVQNPAMAFADPDLKAAQPVVGPTGLPLPRSGNFADVYQLRGADGRNWAVKCFTRPVTGLDHRYQKVADALAAANLRFTIPFTFLNEGVRVRGQWLPAVKMEWVDGLQLNQVVRENSGNPAVLDALLGMWVKLCKRLREAGIAHADIQHGNVMLVPGARAGAFGLKLIDYDGMYVPALANSPSGETGHPNFQHPGRAASRAYSPDLDRFPHLVVAAALKGLAVLGPSLWDRFDTGDNLLFTEDDFRNPAGSKLLHELWKAGDPGLSAIAGRLIVACGKPIPQTPWLDQIAPDGVPVPLSASSGFVAVTAPQPPLPRAVVKPPPVPIEPPAPPARPKRSSALIPVAVIGGLLLVASGVAIALLLDDPKPRAAQSTEKEGGRQDEDRDPPQPPETGPSKPPDLFPTPTVPKPVPPRGPDPGVTVLPPARPKESAPDSEPIPPPRVVVSIAIPDAALLARAETVVRADLKEDYARKLPAERKAFAQRLIALGEQTVDDPPTRYVLLRDARDLATDAHAAVVMAQAIDALAKWYEIDADAQKIAGLEKILGTSSSATSMKDVLDVAIAGSDAAFEADDFDLAGKYATQASVAARRGQPQLGASAIEDAEYRMVQARKAKDAFAAVKPAFDKLKVAPDDPEANLAAGKFRCFAQGRWEDGLKLLARGNHPALRAAAELDLTTPRAGIADVKIADLWWDFAQTVVDHDKKAAEWRARFWYIRALAGLTGLPRGRAESRSGFTSNMVEYRPGLVAEFSSTDKPGILKGIKGRIDPTLDFLGSDFADKGKLANLTVKWTGAIVPPRAGRYRLVVDTPDQVKLKVDNKPVLDTATNKGSRKDIPVTLVERPTSIVLEFVGLNTDKHHVRLYWIAPGTSGEELVPAECLFHDRKLEATLPKP